MTSRETRTIAVVHDTADPISTAGPVGWAVGQLRTALSSRGIRSELRDRGEDAQADSLVLLVASGSSALAREVLGGASIALPDAPEALALVPGRLGERPALLATGSDVRGMVYAVLELADRVSLTRDPLAGLTLAGPIVERPANPIRGVARLFCSEVEDKPWFYDRELWRRYLSSLVSQRFNRMHLALGLGYNFVRGVTDAYFVFPYPFFMSVPGYSVRVRGLPDAERDRNLATLRFIAEEAAARGLHFQLGLWMHAYRWIDSPRANYTIEGLDDETHAAYCRDALRALLQECPGIAGVTFRVHGESGVPEGSYEFWKTVFDGAVECGRPVEIDLHPKGADREMLRVALSTGLPVTISPKYTAEHMGLPAHQAAIRRLEQVPRHPTGDEFIGKLMGFSGGSLRYTRYGYADFLEEDRKYGVFYRIWPGTQRLLLWGDPALAAGFGRHGGFSGCLGVELCEPLSFKGRMGSGQPGGRDAYADASLRPEGGDFEKYLYTYRLFGRLLYNPDADPDSWRRYLTHELGAGAPDAEAALAAASRILPLVTTAHHPSADNCRFWPEMYTNQPIVDPSRWHPYGDTDEPRLFGNVSALDPELFTKADEFADEVIRGERSGRYSPLRVARWLDDLAAEAARRLAAAESRVADRRSPTFRRLAVDAAIQSHLGRFFAAKLRAATAWALYTRTGKPGRLREALDEYRSARSAYAAAAESARGVYRDDVAVGSEPFQRGHWADRLAAIDADLGDVEAEWVRVASAAGQPEAVPVVPLAALDAPEPGVECHHTPPASFRRGEPVDVELRVAPAVVDGKPITVRLRYRHVNQAERYEVVDVVGSAGVYRATIPGGYADTTYPLQYLFELRCGTRLAWLYPGLTPGLASRRGPQVTAAAQPYFVVRQEGAARRIGA